MLDQVAQDKLKKSLIKHEGRSSKIYTDSVGKLTGAIGYNFTDRGIPDWFIERQYNLDILENYNALGHFKWFTKLNQDRQVIVLDMSFMGVPRLLTFHNFIDALSNDDYERASNEMLNSVWAYQVKERATGLAKGMLTGVYNP